jgi:hypothetical protein
MRIPTMTPINRLKGKQPSMETIHTLQEFMLHTKNITYLLIIAALVGITGFWLFLNGRDDD